MTTARVPHPKSPPAPPQTRRSRQRGSAHSLWARAEPLVWLISAGLIVCLSMIIGLLGLVVYQGMTTFWPRRLAEIHLIDGQILLGEVTRQDHYELTYSGASMLDEPSAQAARRLLKPRLDAQLRSVIDAGELTHRLAELWTPTTQSLSDALEAALDEAGESTAEGRRLSAYVTEKLQASRSRLITAIAERIGAADTPDRLVSDWDSWKVAEQEWLELGDPELMLDILRDDDALLQQIVASHALTIWSQEVRIRVKRRLVRIGNYELTNEHYRWVNDFQVEKGGHRYPEWALLLERRAWGRFYGTPVRFEIDGAAVATKPDTIWQKYEQFHPQVQQRWRARRKIEKEEIGKINHQLERSRLTLRRVELQHGKESREWQQAERTHTALKNQLDSAFARLRNKIQELDRENARYQIVLRTADNREATISLADIVRAYPPNRLAWSGRLQVYLSRWWEFLSDEPREANTEGGIFPAIWGTVVMTLLMSVAVIPFGVLAALYLREYASAGLVVSIVRISVNNLAGVPSIVFGVFGLGFFCYIVGASLDQLLFAEKLPSPTLGTGGLIWASLTLALLTVPVVIVSTEEALAAVPRSMREGSLACGATQWQTIRRVVLPRALPGMMTGVILSMARGAGEVAPLMLVGAVKLAPELPLDGVFPYLHLQRSFMHLGFHVYDLGFQSQNSEAAKPMVYTTTLLLIFLVATMNLLAIWLRARLRKRFEFSKL